MENRGVWRGKRIDFNDWVKGDLLLIKSAGKRSYSITDRPSRWAWIVDGETLGECTGECDKRHELIFEGDLIAEGDYSDSRIGVVRYGRYATISDEKSCHIGFYIEWLGESNGLLRNDLGYWANHCVIVGNIYDNPELMKGFDNDNEMR